MFTYNGFDTIFIHIIYDVYKKTDLEYILNCLLLQQINLLLKVVYYSFPNGKKVKKANKIKMKKARYFRAFSLNYVLERVIFSYEYLLLFGCCSIQTIVIDLF